MLRFLTAGESHGQALVVTVDGMPAGLQLDIDALNSNSGGAGWLRPWPAHADRERPRRDSRGVRHGVTTGAPIALLIRNRDLVNWQQTMYVEAEKPEGATGAEHRPNVTRPRPGHADLRARSSTDTPTSAMSSSARAHAKPRRAWPQAHWPVNCSAASGSASPAMSQQSAAWPCRTIESCPSMRRSRFLIYPLRLRCADAEIQARMMAAIDAAKDAGDTLGGAFEVIVTGLPPDSGPMCSGTESSMVVCRRPSCAFTPSRR